MSHLHANNTAFAMYTTGTNNAYTLTTTSTVPAIYTTYGGSNISNQFIGWDKQMESLEKIGEKIVKNSGNFPPYNVV